ncbi:MAG: type IV pilus biogenesis/stability protein PilW [Gammaproteobacteria bacterium]|nr:type IV pilus biogenesis/stability protein PilW [Gammaproteobacteria bacterium]
MKRRLALCLLVAALSACTTDPGIGPVDPERASDVNTQLGVGYMQQNRYELAMKKFEKAVYFNPKNAQAHYFKAELHRRLKQYDQAKEHYEIALSLAPNDSVLYNNYGVFLCEVKQYDAAEKHLMKVINDPLYPNKDQAYENLALCHLNQGNLLKAEENFRKALQFNPKLPKTLLNLAQMYYDQHEMKEAYNYFTRFLPLAQHTPSSLWLGYLLESERGNPAVAESYAANLKVKFPDSKEAELLRKLESSKDK